jgi:peptidoglycan/LPS O-acetylase OafA/YrhL
MGLLRMYLALCVVAIHAGTVFPWAHHNGVQAVQIFFMISGFYMALVLSTRYESVKQFYYSRALRIFPPYWCAFLITLIACLISGFYFKDWLMLQPWINHPLQRNGSDGLFLAFVANLTIFGQDWLMFLRHNFGESLQFTKNMWGESNPLWPYLLIPFCWSVGVELLFYLSVPFLNRFKTPWLIFMALHGF